LLDSEYLQELVQISNTLTRDNIGDSMMHAIAFKAAIVNREILVVSDSLLEKVRNFARGADIGWKIFKKPIMPTQGLSDTQVWQLIGIVSTLSEINYCFERIEEAASFTFENSTPVRFYINGIFHYVSTLFLLDYKRNRKNKLPHAGIVIKLLYPLGITQLLDPIYQVLDRPFGQNLSYGQTVLQNRNKQFVHGSFSPENIQDLVNDSNIFDNLQKDRFVQNHWDLYDRLILLRLHLLAILTALDVNFDKYPPQKLFHVE